MRQALSYFTESYKIESVQLICITQKMLRTKSCLVSLFILNLFTTNYTLNSIKIYSDFCVWLNSIYLWDLTRTIVSLDSHACSTNKKAKQKSILVRYLYICVQVKSEVIQFLYFENQARARKTECFQRHLHFIHT